MKIKINNGWLIENETIKCIPSPNFDARPEGKLGEVNLLVIHHISLPPHQFGTGDIEDFFTNQLATKKNAFYEEIKDLRVSAHILLKRNGEIIQFVNFNDRAWHAGKSQYKNRESCNDFSIGIELEGDEIAPYRYAQYRVLAELTKALQSAYPIGNNITGHENIAPIRKADPGPTFDWSRYLSLIKSRL